MKKLLVIGIIVVAATAYLQRDLVRRWYDAVRAPELPAERPARTSVAEPDVIIGTPGPSPAGEPTPEPTPRPQPADINLAVPFSSQAPHGNWELPYQETCEEASVMLVNGFWKGRTFTPDSADAELRALVDWSRQRLGFYFHTTAEQTAVILREYYGYGDVRVFYDIGIGDIKREVAAGRPVIIPAAGRLLGNENFRQPGPVYHMLVVKGYTADGRLITNDVGTRNGNNYVYDPDVFLNAIHDAPTGGDDWPPGVDPAQYILTGKRAMIVVYE